MLVEVGGKDLLFSKQKFPQNQGHARTSYARKAECAALQLLSVHEHGVYLTNILIMAMNNTRHTLTFQLGRLSSMLHETRNLLATQIG